MSTRPLLSVRDLHVHFPIRSGLLQRVSGAVRAVSGISFEVLKGEAFGIVGESGCGKTTVARAILGLVEVASGSIDYSGQDITKLDRKSLGPYRRKVQAVFQDPFSSLNPRKTIRRIIGEPLRVHGLVEKRRVGHRVAELLGLCELPSRFAELYPHEMSGGQRQRVGIARALAMNPETIVCDEAVSALDVSIQAQIINLLDRLRRDLGLTYIFIGHDLSVVRYLCDRVAVMYLGRMMEQADSVRLFREPGHPYTRALIGAVPEPDPELEAKRRVVPLRGEIPNPANPPSGCVFRTRCPVVMDLCRERVPPFMPLGEDQAAACWLAQDRSSLQP